MITFLAHEKYGNVNGRTVHFAQFFFNNVFQFSVTHLQIVLTKYHTWCVYSVQACSIIVSNNNWTAIEEGIGASAASLTKLKNLDFKNALD